MSGAAGVVVGAVEGSVEVVSGGDEGRDCAQRSVDAERPAIARRRICAGVRMGLSTVPLL